MFVAHGKVYAAEREDLERLIRIPYVGNSSQAVLNLGSEDGVGKHPPGLRRSFNIFILLH